MHLNRLQPFPFDKYKLFHDEHLDSEYLEFLELLSKPVENLPSAEIQLEKREAERSGQSTNAEDAL